MFQNKVAVQQDGLNAGQHAVVAVEVRPASLHHANGRVGEMVDDFHQPVCWGNEVGVEDGDELTLGGFEAGVEGSGFESVPICPVNIGDRVAESGVTGYDLRRHLLRLVGGVVQELNVELIFRVVDGADGFNQAVDDELLVEDGQLDGDAWQIGKVAGRVGIVVLLVLKVLVTHRVAVYAVQGQYDHYGEIWKKNNGIEPVPMVGDRGKRVCECAPDLAAQTVRRRQGQVDGKVKSGQALHRN